MKLTNIKTTLFFAIFILLHVPGLSQTVKLKENQKPQKFESVTPEETGFSSIRLHQLDTLLQSYISHGDLPNVLAFVGTISKKE